MYEINEPFTLFHHIEIHSTHMITIHCITFTLTHPPHLKVFRNLLLKPLLFAKKEYQRRLFIIENERFPNQTERMNALESVSTVIRVEGKTSDGYRGPYRFRGPFLRRASPGSRKATFSIFHRHFSLVCTPESTASGEEFQPGRQTPSRRRSLWPRPPDLKQNWQEIWTKQQSAF
jgi:hypothetical protein